MLITLLDYQKELERNLERVRGSTIKNSIFYCAMDAIRALVEIINSSGVNYADSIGITSCSIGMECGVALDSSIGINQDEEVRVGGSLLEGWNGSVDCWSCTIDEEKEKNKNNEKIKNKKNIVLDNQYRRIGLLESLRRAQRSFLICQRRGLVCQCWSCWMARMAEKKRAMERINGWKNPLVDGIGRRMDLLFSLRREKRINSMNQRRFNNN